jgi:hypothetical protein
MYMSFEGWRKLVGESYAVGSSGGVPLEKGAAYPAKGNVFRETAGFQSDWVVWSVVVSPD